MPDGATNGRWVGATSSSICNVAVWHGMELMYNYMWTHNVLPVVTAVQS